jgi:NADPH:quinone reductase-like Zn-dependent oxidoreductase
MQEVDTPIPTADQVLVRVHAASINYPDWTYLRGKPFVARMMAEGVFKPSNTIRGSDIAGTVEQLGAKVTQFQVGDEVYGDLSASGFGAFAEYAAAPEGLLALKPANTTFEQAAAVPMAGAVALQGLHLGKIQAGQEVLVVGAAGGNGSFGVQIAKACGARVTGVCSTQAVELVRSLGADHVIDYKKEDFLSSGQRYDLILATAGYRRLSDYQRALSPEGAYVVTGGSMRQIFEPMLLGSLVRKAEGQTMVNLSAESRHEDLVALKELIEAGKVVPLIDRVFPLAETAQALAYYGRGHARGKVVITMNPAEED